MVVGNNVCGKVLLSCALFRKDDFMSLPTTVFGDSLLIKSERKMLQVYLIGLRGFKTAKHKNLQNEKAYARIKIGDSSICS